MRKNNFFIAISAFVICFILAANTLVAQQQTPQQHFECQMGINKHFNDKSAQQNKIGLNMAVKRNFPLANRLQYVLGLHLSVVKSLRKQLNVGYYYMREKDVAINSYNVAASGLLRWHFLKSYRLFVEGGAMLEYYPTQTFNGQKVYSTLEADAVRSEHFRNTQHSNSRGLAGSFAIGYKIPIASKYLLVHIALHKEIFSNMTIAYFPMDYVSLQLGFAL